MLDGLCFGSFLMDPHKDLLGLCSVAEAGAGWEAVCVAWLMKTAVKLVGGAAVGWVSLAVGIAVHLQMVARMIDVAIAPNAPMIDQYFQPRLSHEDN